MATMIGLPTVSITKMICDKNRQLAFYTKKIPGICRIIEIERWVEQTTFGAESCQSDITVHQTCM